MVAATRDAAALAALLPGSILLGLGSRHHGDPVWATLEATRRCAITLKAWRSAVPASWTSSTTWSRSNVQICCCRLLVEAGLARIPVGRVQPAGGGAHPTSARPSPPRRSSDFPGKVGDEGDFLEGDAAQDLRSEGRGRTRGMRSGTI